MFHLVSASSPSLRCRRMPYSLAEALAQQVLQSVRAIIYI